MSISLRNMTHLLIILWRLLIRETSSKYRAIQEEISLFWEMTVLVVVRKKVHKDMCLNVNGNRDRDVEISRPDSVRFLCVRLDEEQRLQKKGRYMIWIACFRFRCCCPHKETWRYTKMKNTWSYTHKLYSALLMMLGFLNIYCKL